MRTTANCLTFCLTMASIWAHPKSKNWFARYRAANGKIVNRSTGCTDKKEAERIATSWEIEADRERAAKPEPEISTGGISDAIARVERLARTGKIDRATVRELINEIMVKAGSERIDALTSRQWCDSWRKNKAASVKTSSMLKYNQVAKDWLNFLAGKADKAMEAVSKSDAIAYRDHLRKQGLSPGTINHMIKLLRGIYHDAVEQGDIGKNPFAGVASLRVDDSDAKRIPFTKAEVANLIAAAEGDWKGLITLAATTGLRLMDATRLKWKDLNLDDETIRVRTAKTGTVLTLPIHPELSKWLSKQQRGIGAAPIFPNLSGKAGAGKSGLSMSFRRLMDRAKISAGIARKANDRGRTTSQKSFHSLRHFAATQLAAAGVRAEIARQITGHADAEMHANYVNADRDALRNAVNAITISS